MCHAECLNAGWHICQSVSLPLPYLEVKLFELDSRRDSNKWKGKLNIEKTVRKWKWQWKIISFMSVLNFGVTCGKIYIFYRFTNYLLSTFTIFTLDLANSRMLQTTVYYTSKVCAWLYEKVLWILTKNGLNVFFPNTVLFCLNSNYMMIHCSNVVRAWNY